jgi:hypothetical protein
LSVYLEPSCLIQTKSRRWRLVAGTEVIVIYGNAQCTTKQKHAAKAGRLITNNELSLWCRESQGMLAGMSGLLLPSFTSAHSPICRLTLIKMIHRFNKTKTQNGSSALKCSAPTSKESADRALRPSSAVYPKCGVAKVRVHSTHSIDDQFTSIHKVRSNGQLVAGPHR